MAPTFRGDPFCGYTLQVTIYGVSDDGNGSVILLDENRQEVSRWKFTRGWPGKWTGPGLNGRNNEIAMEMLEI